MRDIFVRKFPFGLYLAFTSIEYHTRNLHTIVIENKKEYKTYGNNDNLLDITLGSNFLNFRIHEEKYRKRL